MHVYAEFTHSYAGLRMFMQGLRMSYACLRMVYAMFVFVYAGFTQSLRIVYVRFTQGLRMVYAILMVVLRKVYAGLRQKVGMFTQVYAEFTWKAFPQPMCVNLRRASLRRVYAGGNLLMFASPPYKCLPASSRSISNL
jgi:hypothetical protein